MNIIMEDNHSENPLPSSSMGELVVDTETLVSQTQNRMWSALKAIGKDLYDILHPEIKIKFK
jgi:hypothetical protein